MVYQSLSLYIFHNNFNTKQKDIMDKLLHPERFCIELATFNSERLFKHWRLTTANYLLTVNGNDNVESNHNNYFALMNNILAEVFEINSDADNYNSAMEALDVTYVKPSNTIYNRY